MSFLAVLDSSQVRAKTEEGKLRSPVLVQGTAELAPEFRIRAKYWMQPCQSPFAPTEERGAAATGKEGPSIHERAPSNSRRLATPRNLTLLLPATVREALLLEDSAKPFCPLTTDSASESVFAIGNSLRHLISRRDGEFEESLPTTTGLGASGV
ncbi:hypothetical protein BDK51DRAFT_40639 [Blyttiomyces helicus]|uniref:Uncharacterized protein n=1 Tax=Blyttiomyces helicus TaxID=388810 RepID=A0A4V1IR42_9FUNG|nr:hypothetical protein BDK51DRAFT_40639 [Blyttiomyces helicus]|eukprot:RKO88747.1 hypothetical protein BDK51DRAFT_40639 [Blyttiomyces helicus]